MDPNNNPDDDTSNNLRMLRFKIINESPRTSVAVPISQITNDLINEENDQIPSNTSEHCAKKISLAWHNLRYDDYSYSPEKEQKHSLSLKNFLLFRLYRRDSNLTHTNSSSIIQHSPILRRLNGYIQYHTVNALLGPSAHARGTLLKCLTGFSTSGLSKDSKIYLNECEQKPGVAWVPANLNQVIFTQMSINEILRYAFLFKNGFRNWSRIRQHIELILTELMLEYKILRKRFSQCSLDEQRLAVIAQELMCLNLPTFLFLEEPFVDIDSSSQNVMQSLRQIANHHQLTIIISAQKVNEHLISSFDKLYILANGGVCIYSGSPKLLAQTLRQELDIYQANDDDDDKLPPIEEILKISCYEFTDVRVQKLADRTLIEEHRQLCPNLDQLRFHSNGIVIPGKYFQIIDLFLQIFRHFRLLFINSSFLLRLLFTLLYYVFLSYFLVDDKMVTVVGCYDTKSKRLVQSNHTCEQILQEQFAIDGYVTYQMYSMWFLASMASTSAALCFSRTLRVFQNEHQNRRYSLGVFIFSSLFVHFLDSIFWSMISTTLMYYLIDHTSIDNLERLSLPNVERYSNFLLFYWILFLYHQSYGILICVILFKHHNSSFLLISLSQVIVLIFQLLNNNILVIVERIHFGFFRFIGNYLISIRYIYDGVFYSFYDLNRCDSHKNFQFSSIMFQRYSIESTNLIYKNLTQIIIVCLVIRILAFLILWFRFRLKIYCIINNKIVQAKEPEMIPIDYEPMDSYIRKKSKVRIIHPVLKDDEEVEFCRDKIHLAWRSLSLFTACPKLTRNSNFILRNLNGQFRLGTMNAIIGGQSSLVRTLLLRVLSGQLKARLSPDSKFYESQYIDTNVCFISRNAQEHLISGLTAKQSLIYASIVKNIETNFDHEEMALNILDELDLGNRANTFVDDCSNSEKKRMALALELTSLQMPNLVCIDEATDGLDIITAEMFVRCLRQLSDRHSITFITSFHSINHQLLSMFDQLYCLNQKGVCIYSGPLGVSIRQHIQDISTEISSYPLEELLKYSYMNSDVSEIEKLIQKNDAKIFELDKFLPEDTRFLKKGIKSNVLHFSVISVQRLSKRYRGRWKSSLWFYWITYTSIYLLFGLLLNGLFGSDIGRPNGCIRANVFNGTNSCLQYRTGTKIIWGPESNLLWDNYRYVHLANHLFLLVVLFHTALVFHQELKVFLNEHQNGWFSTEVFYFTHNLMMEVVPMIPVIMIYQYIVDLDHRQENAEQISIYWWLFILTLIATKSIQSISHLVVIIFGSQNRSEFTLIVLLIIAALLFITSNFQIETKFILSFLNVFRYLDEAILVLLYGFFNPCSSMKKQVSLILHRIAALDPNSHFNHCLRVLLFQTVIFRIICSIALLIRSNSDRILNHYRLWSKTTSSNSSNFDWPQSLSTLQLSQNSSDLGPSTSSPNNDTNYNLDFNIRKTY